MLDQSGVWLYTVFFLEIINCNFEMALDWILTLVRYYLSSVKLEFKDNQIYGLSPNKTNIIAMLWLWLSKPN